jgi:hypothetical protein
MRAQTQRTDVLPLTWEIPTAIALAWLLGALMLMPIGQGTAHAALGHGFDWPTGHLPDSVISLVHGRPGVGLPPRSHGRSGPSATVVYVCITVLEVIWTGLLIWVGSLWWRIIGPGAQHGLATRREVRAVLGSGSLKRRREIIRPDLGKDPPRRGHGAP